MSVTMKDVASLAQLSIGTISNYINGKTTVTLDNQRKIEAAILELGYELNVTARSLKTNSFDTIGILIPDFGNTYIGKVVSKIEDYLLALNYKTIVLSYHSDVQKEKELFAYLTPRVDGIIFAPSFTHTYDSEEVNRLIRKVPVVVFDDKIDDFMTDTVIVENDSVSDRAVTKLLHRGKRNIAMIGGPEGIHTTSQRLFGYINAHKRLGIDVRSDLIGFGDYSKTSAMGVARKMLEEHPDIDAFFVTGYRMTIGVLSVLRQRKLIHILPVIGYDAEDIESLLDFPFGYVYQPYDETARKISELIVRRVKGDRDGFPTYLNLDAKIIDFES